MTHRKAPGRRGKVQLIDASSFCLPMRGSPGGKRREILPERTPLKACPEQKDSGIEWLGKIPANWEAKALKTRDGGCSSE